MATELAVGYVSIVPEVSQVGRLLARALANVEGQFGDVGAEAGQRFVRGVDGRLRDVLTGKFATEGRNAGDAFADGAASAADTGGGGGLAGKLGGVVTGLGTVLAGTATAAGAVIGVAVVKGLTDAMEQDAGGDLLQAQLGLNPEQAAAAGRAAGEVYTNNFGDSMAEARDAVGAVWSSLGDSIGPAEDALTRVTEQALTFAQVFGVDVAEAAALAGVVVGDGLAGDATEAFDLMTAAAQNMPANVRGELLPAMEEYGTFLAGLGLTGEEAFGLMSDAAGNGTIGLDKMGDGLKELTIRATDMSATSIAAYEAAGLNAEDMAERFLAGGDTAKGALDDLVDGLLGIEDPVARSNAAIGLFGTPLEDMNVSEIPEFLESLNGMDTALGDVAGATDAAASAVGDNATAKFETFKRKGLMALSDFMGEKVLPGIVGFADKAGPIFDDLLGAWKTDGFAGVAEKLGTIWEKAWPIIQTKGAALFERLRQWVIEKGPGIAAGIGEGIYAVGNWLIQQWPVMAGKMANFYGRIANWVAEEGFPLLGEKLKILGPVLWQWIQDAYPPALQKMAELWAGLLVWVTTTAIPWLRQKGAELGAALLEWFVTDAVPALLRAFESMKTAITTWIVGTAIPWLRTKAAEWFQVLKDKAEEKALEAVEWLKGLPERILTALGDLGTTLLTAGEDLIAGLLEGIGNKAGEIADAVLGPINDAIDGAKDILGINSPSTVFAAIGANTADGFIAGLNGGQRGVAASAKRLAGASVAAATPAAVRSGMQMTNHFGSTDPAEMIAMQRWAFRRAS